MRWTRRWTGVSTVVRTVHGHADMNSVVFPALCVPREFGVYVVRNLSELRRSRAALIWRYRHFEGLRLYDSEEKAYEIMGTSVSSPTSRLGQFVARLLDLSVTLDVELALIGRASLSEVVVAVREAIEDDPESFEELSGRSIDWWKETLGRANSVREVISAFDR